VAWGKEVSTSEINSETSSKSEKGALLCGGARDPYCLKERSYGLHMAKNKELGGGQAFGTWGTVNEQERRRPLFRKD